MGTLERVHFEEQTGAAMALDASATLSATDVSVRIERPRLHLRLDRSHPA